MPIEAVIYLKLCRPIFLTGGAYAPYAPCMSTPLSDSYAKVVCKPATLSAPFRDAVVSAVHNGFEEKDRRARNVSGVPSSSSHKLFIENLCSNELSIQLLKSSNVVVLVSRNRVVYNQFMPLCDLQVMQKR